DRADPLAVRRGQFGQRGARGRQRLRLLGLRVCARSAEGSGNTKLFAFSIDGMSDTTPPSTAIALDPSAPSGSNGWYRGPVGVTVSATDAGSGVYETRCVTDPVAA